MPQGLKRSDDNVFTAIVLAAGQSRRMGTNKNLLPIDGKPLIAHVVGNIAASRAVGDVIVVTGHAPDAVMHLLRDQTVRQVHNARYATDGMLSSVKAGVGALPERICGFFIVLADQPHIQPTTYDELAAAQMRSGAPVVLPKYSDKRGHPVLFAASCATEMLGLSDTSTLRDFVIGHSADLVEVPISDPAVISDLDTPEDYERLGS